MPTELVFPRIIYRGVPDHLGQGDHIHPTTGERVGETKRVDSQDELDAALKDGWRLTRDEAKSDDAADAAAAPDAAAKSAKKK